MSYLSLCWILFLGPLGALCCSLNIDPAPHPPCPVLHLHRSHINLSPPFLSSCHPPLSSPIRNKCQIVLLFYFLFFFKYPLWVIASITQTACCIPVCLNYSTSVLPTSLFCARFLQSHKSQRWEVLLLCGWMRPLLAFHMLSTWGCFKPANMIISFACISQAFLDTQSWWKREWYISPRVVHQCLSAWYSHNLHTFWIICPQTCHSVSDFSPTHIDLLTARHETWDAVLTAGDSGSLHGAAAAVGGADGGGGCRHAAGFHLHGQADPNPAGTQRHTPGGRQKHVTYNMHYFTVYGVHTWSWTNSGQL